jgi:hypothetical protein
MTITILIETDNLAFYGPDDDEGKEVHNPEPEVARILADLVARIEAGRVGVSVIGHATKLHDTNGNMVGLVRVDKP